FKLIKTDRDACRVVLANLADAIRVTAIFIKPFLPATAEIFYNSFNFSEVEPWEAVHYASASPLASRNVDWHVTAHLVDGKPQPLFPKIQAPA
ncbi:MAG: methionine--tRNA ligase, partial [Isosphaeraceae bacterium]